MPGSLDWEIKKRGDETIVVFSGELDENCELESLTGLAGQVSFDLAGIRRVNSEGARRWINLMRAIRAEPLIFVRCSVSIVIQMNMIFGFHGKAQVRSFFAPYLCEATGQEEERLLTLETLPDPLSPPQFPCDGGVLELDDLPERYFAFLLQDSEQ